MCMVGLLIMALTEPLGVRYFGESAESFFSPPLAVLADSGDNLLRFFPHDRRLPVERVSA